jgi:hypothetical protein
MITDVVGLPHRADRVLDQLALGPAPAGTAREQVPEPRPEVGPAEQGVEGHPDPGHHQHDLGERHEITRGSTGSVSCGATGSGALASSRST